MNTLLDLYRHNDDDCYFDDGLQCHVQAIAYRTKYRTGYVQVPEGECADMDAAIRLFKKIDPEVVTIKAGDTTYIKQKSGGWIALFGKHHRTLIHCEQGHPMEMLREKQS